MQTVTDYPTSSPTTRIAIVRTDAAPTELRISQMFNDRGGRLRGVSVVLHADDAAALTTAVAELTAGGER